NRPAGAVPAQRDLAAEGTALPPRDRRRRRPARGVLRRGLRAATTARAARLGLLHRIPERRAELVKLRDLLRGNTPSDTTGPSGFDIKPRDGMVAFTLPAGELEALRSGGGSARSRLQLVALEAYAEQGVALPVSDGYVVPDEVVAGLDADEAAFLGVPDVFPGVVSGRVHGMTTSDRFAVSLTVLDGKYAQPVRRAGPFLDVGTRRYRMPP